MINYTHAAIIVAIGAAITFITRYIPFAVFGRNNEIPERIQYIGKVLPPAMMATLVIYCLKNVNFLQGNRSIPEIIAVLSVILIHRFKRNTLLSIAGATAIYMVLIRII